VGMGQVDRSDDDGRTPMFVAAGQGHTTAVEALAAAGADCTKAHVEGYSPLYAAAQEGHLETVQALVAVGAALDQTTNEADTPLMIASLVRAIATDVVTMFCFRVDAAVCQLPTAPVECVAAHNPHALPFSQLWRTAVNRASSGGQVRDLWKVGSNRLGQRTHVWFVRWRVWRAASTQSAPSRPVIGERCAPVFLCTCSCAEA
jgi:hypothetical protein